MIKNKFKKILIALDGAENSKRVLNMAIYFARQHDTKLSVTICFYLMNGNNS